MATLEYVMNRLREKARPDQLGGMARYGISVEKRLGLSMPDLRKLAKELGKDHALAMELWETGIDDARILAGMVAEPDKLTGEQMEHWVSGFNSWDVCDQVCMNLFEKSPLALLKINEWSSREEEFVRRTAFSLIACIGWHDKKMEDGVFTDMLPLIVSAATDERNFVKKSVNWALRTIGKRNPSLNRAALETAREILEMDTKAARWIARDAIRELESEAVQKRLRAAK